MREYVLEMKNIHKQFPGVYALQDVTLELKKGEVLALLGENGAGKSTLMKILSGVYKYDQGEIMINGRKCDINSPNDSKNLGIGTIYQELCLVPYMTIAENFFLGIEQIDRKTRRLKIKEMVSKTKDILKSLDLDIDPTQSISSLSIAQQQMVEIARAVSFNAEIIIMDEPTSSLTSKEVEKLFELIGKLKKNGISIIYISHRMEEIFRITDRVTVMRDGKNVGTKATDETNQDELISMMVGRVVEQYYTKENHVQDQKVLEVKDIVTQYSNHKLSFDLYKGEILGLTGLVGAGRTETVRVIFGIDPIKQGRIFLEGVEVKIRSPLDAMRMGIGLVPEDRKKEGLILSNG
ncbi:MAG TPA: sugar ABC transporter ATP-binding protein, partial [Anaerovoracaceae bacterium]|nr:sugar ABC transporter ATP-binding protein [Anaerovoracaceae bacterium]